MSGQNPLDTRLASIGLIFGAVTVGYWYYRGAGAASIAPAAPGGVSGAPGAPPVSSALPGPGPTLTPGSLPPSAYTVPDRTINPGGPAPYLPPYAPTLVVPR